MLKDWVMKAFEIETYEAENNKLSRDNNNLASMLEHEKAITQALAADFIKLEREINELKKDPEQYIEAEVERRTLEYEKQHKDDMEHKWYAAGRFDAYNELGVRNYNAKKHGNCLVMDKNGEIYELLQDLEDVKADVDSLLTTEEIELEDLINA